MPILKQDRNSTHHGGIGFPRIIVLAASLDQNNGTIATKKCKRLLSPRHGTVQTLRHVMFHVFSYGHLHVLQVLPLRMFSWTVKRPFQVRTAWSFMDKGVKISTSTLVSVTKGPPESLFTMQSNFRVHRAAPCGHLAREGNVVTKWYGYRVGCFTIHFRLGNMRGGSISCHLWQFKIATKHESYIDVNQMILAYICHYQAWKLGTSDSRASTYQSFCSVTTVICVASRVWKRMLPTPKAATTPSPLRNANRRYPTADHRIAGAPAKRQKQAVAKIRGSKFSKQII